MGLSRTGPNLIRLQFISHLTGNSDRRTKLPQLSQLVSEYRTMKGIIICGHREDRATSRHDIMLRSQNSCSFQEDEEDEGNLSAHKETVARHELQIKCPT